MNDEQKTKEQLIAELEELRLQARKLMAGQTPRASAARVLVVDDDPGLLATMSDILNLKGFETLSAQSGTAALELQAKNDFDAALIDLRLNDMSGLDVLEGIKKRSPETECILLTGHASQDSAIKALQMNAFGYFQKPFEMDQVLLAVRRASEKRRAEKALRESERKFAAFMEHLPGYAYVKDGQRRLTYVNHAFEEFLGAGKDSWQGKTLEELLVEQDTERILSFEEAVLANETPHTGEETLLHNGRRHTFLSNKFPIRQADGSVALGGISIDITDRRLAEEALRKSEEKYYDLFAQSPEDIYIVRQDGTIVEFNRETSIAGNPREELVGRNILELASFRNDPNQAKKLFTQALEGNMGVSIEYRIKDRAGNDLWTEVHPALFYDGETKFLRLMATNVTARKQTEMELAAAREEARESEAKFRRLFEMSLEGIALLTEDGKILEWNHALENLTGLKREEVINAWMWEVQWKLAPPEMRQKHQPEHFKQMVMAYFEEMASSADPKRSIEGLVYTGKGELKYILQSSFPIPMDSGKKVGTIIHDITAQKQVEKRLQAQYEIARILAESATLKQATSKILQTVCELLNWDWGEMWEIDPQNHVLRSVETWHAPSERYLQFSAKTREVAFQIGEGLPGKIWKNARPDWIPDIAQNMNSLRSAEAAAAGLRAAFGFPIQFGNQILGIIVFLNHQILDPDPNLLEMFASTGRQIGQFIERKQVEEKTRSQFEELRVWHDLTLDRETRSMELKREVNQLLEKLKEPPRYLNT